MTTDQHLVLPDGRRLAYGEFGDPSGTPVLYFHGSPSSRMEPLLVGDEVWARHGLRIIAPDRPGMGDSDFVPRRAITDWPSDVLALTDALGLDRFAVLGNSGGGIYVAACAAQLQDRLTAAVIVSGGWRMDSPEVKALPFVNRLVMFLAKRAPWLLRLLLMGMGGVASGEREKELAQMKKRMPPADFAAFEKPGVLEAFGQSMREALKQGTRGVAYDLGLYVQDFGFGPEDIRFPLKLFHGELDMNAPIALTRRMAASLPAAELVIYPNEAHLSTLCNHADEIAQALKSDRS